MESNKSTTLEDIQEILTLLDEVESKASRKYTNEEIVMRAMKFWVENHDRIKQFNEKFTN